MSCEMTSLLEERNESQADSPYPAFLDPFIEQQCAGKTSDQLLFGNGNTHMKRENNAESWFAVAVRRAQKIDPAFPRVTPTTSATPLRLWRSAPAPTSRPCRRCSATLRQR